MSFIIPFVCGCFIFTCIKFVIFLDNFIREIENISFDFHYIRLLIDNYEKHK